jgi:hypothetical protein
MPEAALAQQRSWLSLEPAQRVQTWLERMTLMHRYRRQRLRRLHPDDDEARITRRFVEESYPGEFTAEYLDRYEARVREYLTSQT